MSVTLAAAANAVPPERHVGGMDQSWELGSLRSMRRVVVEVFYRSGSPFVPLAIERVRAAVGRAQPEVDVEIRLVRIETSNDALSRSIRGLPSVRVDGVDVDEAAD